MGRKKECLSRFHIVSVVSFETDLRVCNVCVSPPLKSSTWTKCLVKHCLQRFTTKEL